MELYRNSTISKPETYEMVLSIEDQEVIGEAYSYYIQSKSKDRQDEALETLTEDFALLGIVKPEEYLDNHKVFVYAHNLAELRDILNQYQTHVDATDRPIISPDKNQHNSQFPDFRSRNLAAMVMNRLAFVEMGSKTDPFEVVDRTPYASSKQLSLI